jgi:hypothetical protein
MPHRAYNLTPHRAYKWRSGPGAHQLTRPSSRRWRDQQNQDDVPRGATLNDADADADADTGRQPPALTDPTSGARSPTALWV